MAEGTGAVTDTDVSESDFSSEGDGHWSDEHEDITSNADVLKHARKYKTVSELTKAGFELSTKLGKTYRLPDDLTKLGDDQKTELLTRTRQLRDVPEKPEDYEFEVPEGMPRNEKLEAAFRAFAHERGYGKKDTAELMDFYHNALKASRDADEEGKKQKASKAEQEWRVRCGATYDTVEENIKRMRMKITDALGFGYTGEKGELCSKFDDCLDETEMGNKIPILQMLNYFWETYEAEGEPVEGSGAGPGKDSSHFDYKSMD